jgi:hypothetical protein
MGFFSINLLCDLVNQTVSLIIGKNKVCWPVHGQTPTHARPVSPQWHSPGTPSISFESQFHVPCMWWLPSCKRHLKFISRSKRNAKSCGPPLCFFLSSTEILHYITTKSHFASLIWCTKTCLVGWQMDTRRRSTPFIRFTTSIFSCSHILQNGLYTRNHTQK